MGIVLKIVILTFCLCVGAVHNFSIHHSRLHTSSTKLNLFPVSQQQLSIRSPSPLKAYPAGDESEDYGIEFEQGLEIFKRKGGKWQEAKQQVDNRDALPYTVYCATPPRTKLGTFRLDPLLSPGDRVNYKNKSYVIKKVRNKYKFRGGKFRMFAKEADATELSRSFTEQVLTNLLEQTPEERK